MRSGPSASSSRTRITRSSSPQWRRRLPSAWRAFAATRGKPAPRPGTSFTVSGVPTGAERSTFAMSQGQRHLVCLMAVLAMQPKVILLDEPFAGLDLPTTRRLYAWLDALEQQLVLVTHDIDHLNSFDRILWLEQGRVLARWISLRGAARLLRGDGGVGHKR